MKPHLLMAAVIGVTQQTVDNWEEMGSNANNGNTSHPPDYPSTHSQNL